MKTIERATYTLGGLMVLSGLIHLAMLLMIGSSWEGPLSLRKPTTFGLSFGLTLMNVTLLSSFVSLSNRTRTVLLGVFAVACLLETFLVSMQTWRGVPSHFNVETPFDAGVAQTLAVGGFALVAVIVALTILAFRDRTPLRPVLRQAVRAGLVALVAAQLVGAVMIGTGVRLVIQGNPGLAYTTGGWLKSVHGVLMHGILVLPLLAWLMSKTHWDEDTQVRAMRASIIVYAMVVVGAATASVLAAASP